MKITRVHGREILDSRGNPTVEVDVALDGGMGNSPHESYEELIAVAGDHATEDVEIELAGPGIRQVESGHTSGAEAIGLVALDPQALAFLERPWLPAFGRELARGSSEELGEGESFTSEHGVALPASTRSIHRGPASRGRGVQTMGSWQARCAAAA